MALFTKENAAEMAHRSHVAIRLRKEEIATTIETPAPLTPDAEYVLASLACVRAEIKRLDAMLLKEDEPQHLDRLASARAKLSEVERNLAGRPGAGQLRPTASRALRPVLGAAVPEPETTMGSGAGPI